VKYSSFNWGGEFIGKLGNPNIETNQIIRYSSKQEIQMEKNSTVDTNLQLANWLFKSPISVK